VERLEARLHSPPGLAGLACRDTRGQHVLDLTTRSWVDPAHLVAAATLAHAHAAADLPLRVLSPRGADPHHYAGRMHLGRVLDGLGVEHDLPTGVLEHDRHADLLEVRAVHSEDDARALAALVATKVRPDSAPASDVLFSCVAEIALNVADHAGAVGYVAAQTLPQVGAIKFAVADAGRGLRATLSVRGASSDDEALRMALSGFSRLDAPGRGTGLPTTLRELTALEGSMFLLSGRAAVTASGSGRVRERVEASFPGTLVQGVLRLPGRRARDCRQRGLAWQRGAC
jgi:hypothetical protein